MIGRNHLDKEISSIEQDNALLLTMGNGALPNPYPEENPQWVRIPNRMCMYVTDDEAGMSKIVIEVYGNLPKTNNDPEFLADRAIICPLDTSWHIQQVVLGADSWRNI
jgi:hypothetical protein